MIAKVTGLVTRLDLGPSLKKAMQLVAIGFLENLVYFVNRDVVYDLRELRNQALRDADSEAKANEARADKVVAEAALVVSQLEDAKIEQERRRNDLEREQIETARLKGVAEHEALKRKVAAKRDARIEAAEAELMEALRELRDEDGGVSIDPAELVKLIEMLRHLKVSDAEGRKSDQPKATDRAPSMGGSMKLTRRKKPRTGETDSGSSE